MGILPQLSQQMVDSCVDGTVDTFIVVIDELLFIVVGSVDLSCFEAVVIVIFVAIVDCFSVMDDNNIDEFVGMKYVNSLSIETPLNTN
jgi:hypothetical protein